MTFFCPFCWKEIPPDTRKCPHCGREISEAQKRSFEEKLLAALEHPERETVKRAVWILGKIKSRKSTAPLIRLFRRTGDPYLKAEILGALAEIGEPEGIEFLREVMLADKGVVGKRAARLLKGLGRE
jgi:HEAT repeat protein